MIIGFVRPSLVLAIAVTADVGRMTESCPTPSW
jgi:hypothetical protein